MNKETILSELFFSMKCDDITAFCRITGVFKRNYELVAEYNPTFIGKLINDIHGIGEDVNLTLNGGLCDSYLICRYCNERDGYEIGFLPDENEAFEDAFDFHKTIIPLLEDKARLDWVINHSGRKLNAEEKHFLFGRPLKVTIEYNIISSCVSIEDEVQCIKDILGVDSLVKEDIIKDVNIKIAEV